MASTNEFPQTFKEKILKFYRKYSTKYEQGILLKSFQEASITLIAKPEKDTGKTSIPVSPMNIDANIQPNISKWNIAMCKKYNIS